MKQLLACLELGSSKYHTWKKRYGKAMHIHPKRELEVVE